MRRFSCLVIAATLLASVSAAQVTEPEHLRKLFPFQAEIAADSPGLCRVALPPEILRRCRSNLSDLRVFDAQGRELAYVIDSARAPEGAIEVVYGVEATILDVELQTRRPQRRRVQHVETYVLEVPELPDGAASWEVVVATGRGEFVRRVELEERTATGDAPLGEPMSVFRLRSPAAERTRIELPRVASGVLVLRLVGEDGSYLRPQLRLEASRSIPRSQLVVVPLEQIERQELHDRTEIVLRRPRGLVPSRLWLRTSTGAFHRTVEVWDEGAGSESKPLASKTLFRVNAIAPVEDRELRLRSAGGDLLRLVVLNRDSPPLGDVVLVAAVPRAALFLSLPDGTRHATLRFGGGRAHRPDYDLAGLLPHLVGTVAGEAAEKALALWDPLQVPEARLGPVVANPHYDPAPALAFAMRPGSACDAGPYSHRRVLQVEPSAEGLSRLYLGLDDLALARADLADLRVVDEEGRQWAYLLGHNVVWAAVPLPVGEERRKGSSSHYELLLPAAPMEVSGLVLHTASPFFDRVFLVRADLEGAEGVTLTGGRLARRHGDPRPVRISFASRRVLALELVVEDGDDAPLVFDRIVARSRRSAVYVAAPTGSYTLLLGNPKSSAPRYELERVRRTVLAVPSAEIAAGALEANPDFSLRSRMAGAGGMQQVALWVVLGLAVLLLAGLTLRLARQEGGDGEG